MFWSGSICRRLILFCRNIKNKILVLGRNVDSEKNRQGHTVGWGGVGVGVGGIL